MENLEMNVQKRLHERNGICETSLMHQTPVGISLLYWYIRQNDFVGQWRFRLLVSDSFSVRHLYFNKINPHSIYQFMH